MALAFGGRERSGRKWRREEGEKAINKQAEVEMQRLKKNSKKYISHFHSTMQWRNNNFGSLNKGAWTLN
jgi:hypothetical protein